MKPMKTGFYRMIWSEGARSIGFTWHRSRLQAEAIHKRYRWQGTVQSDYYHHYVEGSAGLDRFAAESGFVIDWENARLNPKPEAEKPPEEKPSGRRARK